MYVSEDKKIRAREADLYSYLLENHPEDYVMEGDNTLRHKKYDSLKIFKGYGGGSFRFSDGESGNAIDFLNRYVDEFGSNTSNWFQRAVLALLPYSPELTELDEDERYIGNKSYVVHTKARTIEEKVAINVKEAEARNDEFVLPQRASNDYKRVFAYLTKKRGIPASLVKRLFNEKLLYEDVNGNCIFNSAQCRYAEVRGTSTFGEAFKQSIGKIYNGGYWAFNAKPSNSIVFICEAAIDAISLYCLLGNKDATYVSVGGCTKSISVYNAMHDDKLGWRRYVIAFDNDSAGNEAYSKLKSEISCLERILPTGNDWNDDLIASESAVNKKVPEAGIINTVPEITWNELPGGNYCYEGKHGIYGAYEKSETTITPEIINMFVGFCNDINSRFHFNFDPYDLHNMFVDKYNLNPTYSDSVILTEIAENLNNCAA